MVTTGKRPYVRSGYGPNLHALNNIFHIMLALDDDPLAEDDCQRRRHDPGTPDLSEVRVAGRNGLVVTLRRGERATQDAVWVAHAVDRVEADTREQVDRFDEALEAAWARRILDSWVARGWPADRLRRLSDRKIMVVDGLLDMWAGDGETGAAETVKALEGEDGEARLWAVNLADQIAELVRHSAGPSLRGES